MKQELLDMLEELGPKLPPNTLDELIEELGGTDNVVEVSACGVKFCTVNRCQRSWHQVYFLTHWMSSQKIWVTLIMWGRGK